jgi:hypothetical protein
MSDKSAGSVPLVAGYPDDAVRIADHGGEPYVNVLDRIHRHLSPRTYLEIGTQRANPWVWRAALRFQSILYSGSPRMC